MKLTRYLGTAIALSSIAPFAAQAKEVKIICDIRGEGSDGRELATTRTFLLDDAKKSFSILGDDGPRDPCDGQCEVRYTSETISYTRGLGKGGSDQIRFSLNRLSGRMRETWEIPTMKYNRSMEGPCEVASAENRKF